MWITLLVMAAAVSLEPFRVGMCVVLMNRPRPRLQLAAFLGGGFLMGLSVGAVVLFVLTPRLPDTAHVTLPRVQIGIGALALLAAAGIATVAATGGGTRTPPGWLTSLHGGRSLWVAGAAGLGIALPSVDYLAALAVIAAAGVSPGTRLAALLLFTVAAFALVEIALLAHLVAPQRTRAAMAALHGWVRARGRRGMAALLALVGIVLIGIGLAGI